MGVLVTKIKEYRESAGMKQAELAELVDARRKAFPILFTTETTQTQKQTQKNTFTFAFVLV